MNRFQENKSEYGYQGPNDIYESRSEVGESQEMSPNQKLEYFKANYNINNNIENQTDSCNSLTARLIIFYTDELIKFFKENYNKNYQDGDVNIILKVFVFFFTNIFFYNYKLYDTPQQDWVVNQSKMIERLVSKNKNDLGFFQNNMKFLDDFSDIKIQKENSYIYTIDFNNLNLKNIFISYIKIIQKYYRAYYNKYFVYFFDKINGNQITQHQEELIPAINVNLNISPINENNIELFKYLFYNKYNDTLEKDNEFIELLKNYLLSSNNQKIFNEINSFLENSYTEDYDTEIYSYSNQKDWDDIFKSGKVNQKNIPYEFDNAVIPLSIDIQSISTSNPIETHSENVNEYGPGPEDESQIRENLVQPQVSIDAHNVIQPEYHNDIEKNIYQVGKHINVNRDQYEITGIQGRDLGFKDNSGKDYKSTIDQMNEYIIEYPRGGGSKKISKNNKKSKNKRKYNSVKINKNYKIKNKSLKRKMI
jgi:hypothetical protein